MYKIISCELQSNIDGCEPKSNYQPVAVPIWHGPCSPHRYWSKKRRYHPFQRWIEARTVLGSWLCGNCGEHQTAAAVACPECGEPAPVCDPIAFGEVRHTFQLAAFCEVRIRHLVGRATIKLHDGRRGWSPTDPQLRLTLGMVGRLLAIEAAFGQLGGDA